jgi:hypothetical protein
VDRESLVNDLTSESSRKRWAVVCAAGLGKSTNLQWLAKELALPGSRQVPFLFALDRVKHATPEKLLEVMLPAKVRAAPGNSDLTDERLLTYLRRLRAQGRITLLLDSIDQSSEAGLQLVSALLATRDWDACPIVLSARPHALFDRWDDLIIPDEASWQFVRVEPLAAEQSGLLLNQDVIDRWSLLPADGKVLMANPRNIEYVRKRPVTQRQKEREKEGEEEDEEPDKVKDFTLHDLRTASHVFAGAVDHLVRYGMENPEARKFRCRKDEAPPAEPSERQIRDALDFLGALAFEMYTMPAPDTVAKEGTSFRPNVSHVDAEAMPDFTEAVWKRLRRAKVVRRDYGISDLEKDLQALAELNAEIKYDLLDTRPSRQGDFRWYDRSLQEFFAAWWLSRYAGPGDVDRLHRWRYDDPRDATGRTLYQPLWGFLVEMPLAVRKDDKWLPAVKVLFEPRAPRCCEMIYRCWQTLRRTQAEKGVMDEWQKEFRKLLDTQGPQGDTAREIPAGFRRCPPDPTAGSQRFEMGSPEGEADRYDDEYQHWVTLSPFLMRRYPVTNAQFELFDPGHAKEHWESDPHPAGEEAKDHPVLIVNWFEAWCFAMWTGNHLPTEAQWEYACRGGACSYQTFHFGNSLSSRQANFNGDFPYGDAEPGDWLERTTKVGSYPANGFGLHDMHGNVWEWCADWSAANFYKMEKALLPDPVNDEPAIARVLRGGGWYNLGRFCRSAFRFRHEPDYRRHACGFRLAAVPDVGAKPGEGGA